MPQRRRTASDDVWAMARVDYEAGFTAAEVCDHYELGEPALRARVRRDAWTRPDVWRNPGVTLVEIEADRERVFDRQFEGCRDPTPDALANRAWRQFVHHMLAKRSGEARRWWRIAMDLRAMAARTTTDADLQEFFEAVDETEHEARRVGEDARRQHLAEASERALKARAVRLGEAAAARAADRGETEPPPASDVSTVSDVSAESPDPANAAPSTAPAASPPSESASDVSGVSTVSPASTISARPDPAPCGPTDG